MKKQLKPVALERISLTGGLLAQRQTINRSVTVPVIMEKCESTGRVRAILHQWDGQEATRPHPFWDSDIGKTIESAAYALIGHRDAKLEADIDRIIDMMVAAQEEDGYFNSYYQTCEPKENRWTNLYYMHELYCMGHLIEGAVAYHQATGKRKFLDMMCRYADLACTLFLEGGKLFGGYCGHPEIEMALVRLYEVTRQKRYLDLAYTFVDQRGRQPWYFETESLKRGVNTEVTANQKRHLKYFLPSRGPYAEYQAQLPIREQNEPVGHAVRAMYLLAGVADVADYTEDEALYLAAKRIWNAMTGTQMAIIGGIGTASDGERFTFAYDIPNELTYNETCASVALMMAGMRLLQFKADGAIADVVEQVLYNTILASVSLKGDSFFYANYLDVCPERFHHASKALIDKMAAQRQPWFNVACCPPNVSRLIGALGQYVASTGSDDALYLHLHTSCVIQHSIRNQMLNIRVESGYPWSGHTKLTIAGSAPCESSLWIHIPGWCREWSLRINGEPVRAAAEHGYVHLLRRWMDRDEIEVDMSIKPVLMEADPRVRQDGGRVALMRGPVVYCLEEIDNGRNLHDIAVPIRGNTIRECRQSFENRTEVITLVLDAVRYHTETWASGRLYQPAQEERTPVTVEAVPYFVWGNRGFGEMLVWMNRT